MRPTDLIGETIRSLTANLVRSSLTILGIVVGIASVIAMLAIGEGSQAAIEDSIRTVGSNMIFIMPAMPGNAHATGQTLIESLKREDADALARIDGVKAVTPVAQSVAKIVFQDKDASGQVIGATENYASVSSLTIAKGEFFNERDDTVSGKVVVLGSTMAEDLFEGVSPIGKTVRVGTQPMRVIGVLEEKGASSFTSVDSAVIIPLSTLQHYFSGTEYLQSITLQVEKESELRLVEEAAGNELLVQHDIDLVEDADFRTMNMNDLLKAVSQVTGIFTTLLAAIAGISLLVGGIGIMNMMLTTVTERTREIGLRKAIGATSGAISAQFLAESVTLTFLGGIIGILTGWGIAQAAGSLMNINGIVTSNAVGLAFGVCAFIGIVFGFYPARRAAAMSPIDALRYQ